MNFFETFLECSLPGTVSKNTIKMIGHHSRLRHMMGQSYLICACTRVNHARYLHFAVARNIVYKSNTWEKYLTGRKCRANREQYDIKFVETSPYLKRRGCKAFVESLFCGHNLHHRVTVSCTLSPISFFPSDKFF